MNLLLVLLQLLSDELLFVCRFLQFICDLLQRALSFESVVGDIFELSIQILYLLLIFRTLLLHLLDVLGLRLHALLQIFKFIDQTVALTDAFLLRKQSAPALKFHFDIEGRIKREKKGNEKGKRIVSGAALGVGKSRRG